MFLWDKWGEANYRTLQNSTCILPFYCIKEDVFYIAFQIIVTMYCHETSNFHGIIHNYTVYIII